VVSTRSRTKASVAHAGLSVLHVLLSLHTGKLLTLFLAFLSNRLCLAQPKTKAAKVDGKLVPLTTLRVRDKSWNLIMVMFHVHPKPTKIASMTNQWSRLMSLDTKSFKITVFLNLRLQSTKVLSLLLLRLISQSSSNMRVVSLTQTYVEPFLTMQSLL